MLNDPTIGFISIRRPSLSLTKLSVMKIIDTEHDFKHPEGKIQLLNGSAIDCYPLKQPAAPQSDAEKEEEEKLFLSNAFRFLQYRNRIMSDSRMFLCPVPIQNGMAYTGTSGFQHPTLGVYLEWWLNCERALTCDEHGTKILVYQIAGSPLSGSNRCGVVDTNGKTEMEYVFSFSSLWSSFIRINSRYDKAKSLYQAYSLKQVVEILDKENLSLIDDKEMEILYLESALFRQQKDMANEMRQLEAKIDMLKTSLFHEHRVELKAIMDTYEEKKEKKEQREKEIAEERKELHRKLKSGEIDNKQYQKQLTPLKKEKESNEYMLREYRREALRALFPRLWFITIGDVEKFCSGLKHASNEEEPG